MINKNYGKQVFLDSPQSKAGYLRRQKWTDAVAADADRLKNDQATSNSAITEVTTFTAQPDHARKITVTPGGTTASVPAGDVTVEGTNIRGEAITDTITFEANAEEAGSTAKAFKTVSKVTFPIQDGTGATYDIGVSDALGLDRCMSGPEVLATYVNEGLESSPATVTFHATDVSRNTVDPDTALDGSAEMVVVYVATEITSKAGTTA